MKIKNIKKILPAAILAIGALIPFGAAHAADNGWGPERATFSWNKPASYVTFNSITDNPEIGDERNFVRVRKADTNDTFKDSVELEVGAEYEVYIYYHNNASANLNESGKGIAENTQVSTSLPEKLTKGQSGVVKATIFSPDANPTSVYDEAYLKANDTVYLRYVPNSAVIHNHGSANGSVLDADSLFDTARGAKIAHYKDYWGMIPGCNEYAGYIVYRVKVDKPGFMLEKTASKSLANEYGERVYTKPGETVDFKIVYKNTGTTDQLRVVVYDQMPSGMKYVAGTTFVKTPAHPEGEFVEDKLFNGGLVIGDFHGGEMAEITYKAVLDDDKNLFPCGTTKIYNNSSVATANGTEYDKVEVTVTRNCQAEENGCYNEDGTVKNTPECKCINEDGTTKNTPECNSCYNEDGTVKDTPECKCYNEDGSVKDTDECRNLTTTPDELPSTGPTEIALTVVILSSVWIAGAYWFASQRELSKIKKNL